MSNKKLSVAIVGAGMGGLAVAATLRRVGIDVQVYEQAARFARIGAGIQMMPNSMKVLRGIGIEERLRKTSFAPYSHLNRDGTLVRSPASCRCPRASTARPISACIAPTCTTRSLRPFRRDRPSRQEAERSRPGPRAGHSAIRGRHARDRRCG